MRQSAEEGRMLRTIDGLIVLVTRGRYFTLNRALIDDVPSVSRTVTT
jgi:hypothetical protein